MRVSLQAVNTGCVITAAGAYCPPPPNCASGQRWDDALQICALIPPAAVTSIPPPVGYDPATGTVDPGNEVGQTIPGAPTSSEGLCKAAGGTIDPSTGLCVQPQQTDWTPVYVAAGVGALLLLVSILKK